MNNTGLYFFRYYDDQKFNVCSVYSTHTKLWFYYSYFMY